MGLYDDDKSSTTKGDIADVIYWQVKFANEKLNAALASRQPEYPIRFMCVDVINGSKDLLKELFDLGFMSVDVPEEYGGQGGTFFQAILAIEELAKVDPSASLIVDVHNTLFHNAILQWGTQEQKRRWLASSVKDTVGAYALSEAGAGSDAFRSMRTTATPRGLSTSWIACTKAGLLTRGFMVSGSNSQALSSGCFA